VRFAAVSLTGGLIAGLALPVLMPVLMLAQNPAGWQVWTDAVRLSELAANTFLLAMIATGVSVPLGMAVALALVRARLFAGQWAQTIILAALFIPLPVVAVAWQVVLGTWLPPFQLSPGDVAWRPWSQGLLPAGWVHGMAGFPWVVWIATATFRRTDPILEADARMIGGNRAIFRLVILPRATAATVAALAWVVLQTATEIPITDAMMVRSFAEEVYTQLVGGGAALASAVAVAVPIWIAAILGIGCTLPRVVFRLGATSSEIVEAQPLVASRRVSRSLSLAVWVVILLSSGLPLAALIWKAAGGGTVREGASLANLVEQLVKVLRTHGPTLGSSLLAALVTGMIAATLAFLACVLARASQRFRSGLLLLVIVLAVTPGPLVGLGLKELIRYLVDWEDLGLLRLNLVLEFPPLRSLLYDQPSAVPAGWAAVIRWFPLACALLWLSIRAIPQPLFAAAALDGHSVLGRIPWLDWPLSRSAVLQAAGAVAVLALGEVSAGKIVNPPFHDIYILRLFDQMHYGTEPTVAALCLVQVFTTLIVLGLFSKLAATRGSSS
jgi:iron(III) transport system permease protein